jgi:hypothetical protein
MMLTSYHEFIICLHIALVLGGSVLLVAIAGLVLFMRRRKSNSNKKSATLGGHDPPAYSSPSSSYLTTGIPPPMAQPTSPQVGGPMSPFTIPPTTTSANDGLADAVQNVSASNAPPSLSQSGNLPFHPSARSVEYDPYEKLTAQEAGE